MQLDQRLVVGRVEEVDGEPRAAVGIEIESRAELVEIDGLRKQRRVDRAA